MNAWLQLRTPDLTKTVRPGWCLGYVSQVLGIDSSQYRSAKHAQLGTQHFHGPDEPLLDVPVLVWFDHEGPYDDGQGPYDGRPVGAVGNWGHVVYGSPEMGFYSSPLGEIGDPASSLRLGSIAEVERRFNSTYVGWSEDLAGVRFAEPTFISSSESEDTMLYLMIIDGKGRYGAKGKKYFAIFTGRVHLSLTPEDANAIANTNLAGRSFANVTYSAWDAAIKAAEVVM